MSGPILRFNTDAVVAVTSAAIPVKLDDVAQPMNTAILIKAGSTLTIGTIAGAGARAYLAVRGGVQVPEYLGSKSTFTLGQFGGHGGRALRAGDVLHLAPLSNSSAGQARRRAVQRPAGGARAAVIYGPHGAPEYFTEGYIDKFFATDWEVHFNSSRTGVRLIGPKPEWVRESGGEAGLHPSNIHDNPYAIGAVDFTGDMPVILGPDGPSLGGFVCPVTIIEADLWQLGQLKAGDKVRFVPVDVLTARQLAKAADAECASLAPAAVVATPVALQSPIVLDIGEADSRLVARLSGDTHLLLEIGAPELDLVLRFRGHALMQALEAKQLDGVIDLTPGIRSLQVHYQPETLALEDLLEIVAGLWDAVRRAGSEGALAHRPPAAVLGRPGLPVGHREVHDHGAQGRALVPEQPGVHPPHQRPAQPRRGVPHGVRRQLPGDGPRRRVSRCAGGHSAGPAPPPGHHQVQPGAHLDRGELGGHRRPTCASTAWKARAATSSSAAPCRCGTATARSRRSAASRGCCASSTRSASTRSRPRSCRESAAIFRSAATR